MSQITEHLRHPSPRPTLVVDRHGRRVGEAEAVSRVGIPGPFGRERVVYAFPMQWVELKRATLLRDRSINQVADGSSDLTLAVVGEDRVIVHRMVWATKAADTRRL